MAIHSHMQNPNPYNLHPPQHYDQCSINGNNAACNSFPVSNWMADTQNGVYGGGSALAPPPQNHNAGFGCQDIDSYINFQSEKLRRMVQEHRKLELAWLMKKFESRTLALTSQKDEQIHQLTLRIMELQRLSSSLQVENESLQAITRQNETTIESLNLAIDQLQDFNNQTAEDAESCCDFADLTPHRVSSGMRLTCGQCGSREANVVFLPCTHLCACDACEHQMSSCPVCKKHKTSSIFTLVF